jgi:hypothetical protein
MCHRGATRLQFSVDAEIIAFLGNVFADVQAPNFVDRLLFGLCQTYRTAVEKDSRKFSDGDPDSASGPFHCNRAKITTTKQRAFTAKTQFAPRK